MVAIPRTPAGRYPTNKRQPQIGTDVAPPPTYSLLSAPQKRGGRKGGEEGGGEIFEFAPGAAILDEFYSPLRWELSLLRWVRLSTRTMMRLHGSR